MTPCAKADQEDLTPVDTRALSRLVAATRTAERTESGREIETAVGEALAQVRGEAGLLCRSVALGKRFRLSRQKLGGRFGLDARALQERELGH